MHSICLATYNGKKYLRPQLDSILAQLGKNDELIISDDGSTDGTIDIIQSYNDPRIKFFHNQRHGVANNFENALSHSAGDLIFFADQDDVWLPNKISKMENFLREGDYDMVMCNCSLTDSDLNNTKEKHFDSRWPMKKSIIGNLINNCWLGACTVFTPKVKEAVLPFPRNVVAHDLWVCLFAQINFRCGYLDEVLQLYRRHDGTVSFTGKKSTNPIGFRIKYRLYLIIHLIYRSFIFTAKKISPRQTSAAK